MQESLRSLNVNIGYMKRSERLRVEAILRSEKDKEDRLNSGRSPRMPSPSLMAELRYLVSMLADLYKTEKNFEGTDRLFSTGRELRSILESAGVFLSFENALLNYFKRDFRDKIKADQAHTLRLGKARALMEGLGEDTLTKFNQIVKQLRIVEETGVQAKFLEDEKGFRG